MRRTALVVAGVSSVVPLLAWVYGLGSFRLWFLATAAPGALALVALSAGPLASAASQRVVRLGVIAGLVGTVGYDLFRVPFVFGAGFRLLSPIESYGVLLLGAGSSSGASDFAGWAWHLANGIGFAVAYIALCEGRAWPSGLVWAAVLETATVLTPFADVYGLRGKSDAILIAYAAHVPYGVAVGLVGRHAWALSTGRDALTRFPASVPLGLAAVVLVGWLQPLRSHEVAGVPPGVTASIIDGRLHPEFIRVAPGGCAPLANLDDVPYQIAEAVAAPVLRPHAVEPVCFDASGVHRVRVDGEPFHGGFVIVDRALGEPVDHVERAREGR